MMESMALKGVTFVFFILISSSYLLPYAGGRLMFTDELVTENTEVEKEAFPEVFHHHGSNGVHPRMLRVNTKDYDTYDPAPALEKPPFKLIPN